MVFIKVLCAFALVSVASAQYHGQGNQGYRNQGGYGNQGYGNQAGYGIAAGGYGNQAGGYGYDDEHYGPAEYEFSYAVHDDHTKDIKQQKESRHGDKTEGEYSFLEADGTTRIVKYFVDGKSGFVAQVIREGKAVYPAPAPRAVYAHAPQAAYAAPVVAKYVQPAVVAKYVAPVAIAHAAPVAIAHAPVAIAHAPIVSGQSYQNQNRNFGAGGYRNAGYGQQQGYGQRQGYGQQQGYGGYGQQGASSYVSNSGNRGSYGYHA